jgi:hypothetical protein
MVELASVIRPGDGVVWGQACAEPQTLVELFVAQRESFSGARVFLGASYSGLVKPSTPTSCASPPYCGSGHQPALADAGVLEIYPTPYSQLGGLIRDGRIGADVVLVQVSPPNARGEYSLGLGVEYLAPALRASRAIRRGGQRARAVDPHRAVAPQEGLRARRRELARAGLPAVSLGRHRDGHRRPSPRSTFPTARCSSAASATCRTPCSAPSASGAGCAFHSGLIPDGVAALHAKGALTGEIRGGCLMGTQDLFDWARENPQVRLHSSDYTHGAAVLAKLERFVAINSAVEVDLTGQVNAEVARASYVGAVGRRARLHPRCQSVAGRSRAHLRAVEPRGQEAVRTGRYAEERRRR